LATVVSPLFPCASCFTTCRSLWLLMRLWVTLVTRRSILFLLSKSYSCVTLVFLTSSLFKRSLYSLTTLPPLQSPATVNSSSTLLTAGSQCLHPLEVVLGNLQAHPFTVAR
jgi:hypothetical protein